MDTEPEDTQEFIFEISILISKKFTTQEKEIILPKIKKAIEILKENNNSVVHQDLIQLWFIRQSLSLSQ
jgi:hypothetical protein